MHYHEPLFRPPAEANSLIFQIAYGCPHNSCRFCQMYKSVKYHPKNITEILQEIRQAGELYSNVKRVFLADGDVMALPFAELEKILMALNRHLPALARVNSYANGCSIAAKTDRQLQLLAELKLNTIYLGLESGDDKILRLVNKPDNVATMIEAVERAQHNGLKCSVMALLGIGGQELSQRHAKLTARALNLMQPRLLSILRFIETAGTRMYSGYQPLSEYGAVKELHEILARLTLERTVFTANHASNPLPLKGRLPHDQKKLLNRVEQLLQSGNLDRHGSGSVPLWL